MSDCPSCEMAEADPRSNFFGTPDCKECCARALAGSPSYFDASRAGTISGTYKSALRYFFSAEPLTEAHARVTAWADRIKGAE
jgi:hypothetical protein